ncbi:MAG: hypothetical protein SCALA702_02920 [Melioribacteraceae bacterium]|nr:MAG: hypothetical protein SCALA702_02920 [Melioribacteraceae bacterium]
MANKKVLFICGSLNQTTMMHKISQSFGDGYDFYFSPFYADGYIEFFRKRGFLNFSILGGNFFKSTRNYLVENNLNIDFQGKQNYYDLVFTGSDLIVPNNVRGSKLILVQEGMTDPENLMYYLVKYLNFPRWMASTSTTGLSNLYDYFCVASEGYKDLFIKKGVPASKLIVTGIPNFDNTAQYLENEFEHKNYVMVATSDSRETFKYENRKKFIYECLDIADGRQLLFKFHPNENFERATAEVKKYAPGALIYTSGNTNHMIANCDTLVTKYSSVVYIGIALKKEVYSWFDINELKRMTPIQNGGTSATNIAKIGEQLLDSNEFNSVEFEEKFSLGVI